MITGLTEKEIEEIADDREIFQEIEKASESSLGFWDNDIDDETWSDL